MARSRHELSRDMLAIRNAVGNPKARSTILKSTSDAKIQTSRAMIREAKRRLATAKPRTT